MNKKRVVVIIFGVAIVAVFGMFAFARGNGVSKKLEVNDEVNQTHNLIENLPSDIESQKATEQSKIFDAIPVFSSQKLFFDNGVGIFLGRDVGVDKDFPNTRPDYIGRILSTYPTNAIREANENMSYMIYDTEIGVRLYLFISKEKSKNNIDGFPIIMQKTLSYKDFSSIAVGDSITHVGEVDPIVSIYIHRFNLISDGFIDGYTKQGAPPTSVHVLKDGVLKIEYKRTADKNYEIVNMTYKDDFILEGLNGKTNYRIDPADYIDCSN